MGCLQAIKSRIHTGRHRLCARRAVALGQKPFMVGGALEGNAFRHFAYKQLRLPVPVLENGQYPRPAATIIDRGISYDGSIKSRGFANLPGMLRILDKYNISYEVFTDTQARDADGKLWHWSDPRFR